MKLLLHSSTKMAFEFIMGHVSQKILLNYVEDLIGSQPSQMDVTMNQTLIKLCKENHNAPPAYRSAISLLPELFH